MRIHDPRPLLALLAGLAACSWGTDDPPARREPLRLDPNAWTVEAASPSSGPMARDPARVAAQLHGREARVEDVRVVGGGLDGLITVPAGARVDFVDETIEITAPGGFALRLAATERSLAELRAELVARPGHGRSFDAPDAVIAWSREDGAPRREVVFAPEGAGFVCGTPGRVMPDDRALSTVINACKSFRAP